MALEGVNTRGKVIFEKVCLISKRYLYFTMLKIQNKGHFIS